MIVVTGGAGFIGSNVVAALAERSLEVAVVDRLGREAKWRNLAHHDVAALVDPEEFFPWLSTRGSQVEAMVHMGAISATTETDVDLIADTNIRLTLSLWDWCTVNQVPFIYASSAATYGDGSQGFDDDPSHEGLSLLRPLNPYGWSKLFVDRRVARLVREGGATPPQWAGLRFFNVYGPNEYHKGAMRSVAQQAWERATAGEPVRLFRSHHPDYRDGGQLRDFIHVDDCVRVILWLLDSPSVSGLFNCGTGTARSFLELAETVFGALGREPRIEWVDTPVEIRDRYQYFTEARMDRLRAAGYKAPFLTLEEGVMDYVRSYLEGADPYR
jgi:ADP-L-glycero-D-manno-heptose 6-epimerase